MALPACVNAATCFLLSVLASYSVMNPSTWAILIVQIIDQTGST